MYHVLFYLAGQQNRVDSATEVVNQFLHEHRLQEGDNPFVAPFIDPEDKWIGETREQLFTGRETNLYFKCKYCSFTCIFI